MREELIEIDGLELRLRPCRIEDQGFVYEIMRYYLEGYFDEHTSEGWSRKKFKQGFDPLRISIIEHGKMPIGFLDYEQKENEVHWHSLILSGDYHSRGIGTALFEIIGEEANNENLPIRGKVFKDNTRSFNWLRKLGFEVYSNLDEENSYVVEWKS